MAQRTDVELAAALRQAMDEASSLIAALRSLGAHVLVRSKEVDPKDLTEGLRITKEIKL